MPNADGPGVRSGAARLAKSHKQLARVARIDDLIDPERLGGAIGGAQAVQPLLDFANFAAGSGAASISAR